jgi:hypothetical protein
VTLFLVGAMRAIVEMLGLCLLGQGVLYLLAGQQRASNRVYQLFDLITRPPRRMVSTLLPRSTNDKTVGMLSFAIVLILWLGLAFVRKFV